MLVNKENCVGEPIIDESEFEINIYIELKKEIGAKCSHCDSDKVAIKEKVNRRANCSGMLRSSKPIYINIIKRRFECKICKKPLFKKMSLVKKGRKYQMI